MVESEKIINKILDLPWSNLDHEEVKSKLGNFFEEVGFYVSFEYCLRQKQRNEYIDLVAENKEKNYKIGIEIDRATPKLKSIEKLEKLRPNLALMILRLPRIPETKIKQRLLTFPFHFIVMNLFQKRIVFSNFSQTGVWYNKQKLT